MWGLNTSGQCGAGNRGGDIIAAPQSVNLSILVEKQGPNFSGTQQMEYKKLKTLLVECGGAHTLFLSQENNVFACGAGDKGQLGLATGELENYKVPKRIEVLADKTITMIKAGSKHSAALTVEGYCYTWGANERGQLGLSQNVGLRKGENQSAPVIVEAMLGRGLSTMYARYNQTFWGSAEPGHCVAIEGEIFKMWKAKMKRFEL